MRNNDCSNERNKEMDTIHITVCNQVASAIIQNGMDALTSALDEKGIAYAIHEAQDTAPKADGLSLLVGKASDYKVKLALEGNGKVMSRVPESLGCFRCRTREGEQLVLAGADDVGVMYALFEMARKVDLEGIQAIQHAQEYSESPDNQVRCMDRYLLGHLDNEWFLSEAFCAYYFKRLAQARFNRFCLILGFDTAYMSPPYPFFVPVEGFEQVVLSERVRTPREENLRALRHMVASCHQYGIQFVLATWQQRPWTTAQESLVSHLPESELGLSDYCHAGLIALLKAVPDIDIVQFRVNHESGVGTQVSAEDFWKRCIDAVYEAGVQLGKRFTMDLRAKGLTETMVDHAQALNLDVEVPTKYWCEHAALPYHLSIMRTEELTQLDNFNHSRRYSYADMLRKPKKYDVIFRLWNYGSTNLFLWGDPDYARRFSKSCSLSGATGFQVNAPLALKYGHELSHLKPWKVFLNQELNQDTWEDERFWQWYMLFGRLGYNAEAAPELWQAEYSRRYGEEAGSLFSEALSVASRIVPLITTVHMPVHPSLRYWTEMNTGWALFAENNLNKMHHYDYYKAITYGSTEPSDNGLFYGIDEFVQDSFVDKVAQGKYSPLQYAQWLENLAEESLIRTTKLEAIGAGHADIQAACLDMQMLSHLGRYHAHKIRAAYALACWRAGQPVAYLLRSREALRLAMSAWQKLADLGRSAYYHDLDFSSAGSTTRRGTWGDLSIELERDMNSLEELIAEHKAEDAGPLPALPQVCGSRPCLSAHLPTRLPAGQDALIRAHVSGLTATGAIPVLHYRHVNQLDGKFRTISMQRNGAGYEAVIPGKDVSADWDMMMYLTLQVPGGPCELFPGVYHAEYPYPYAVVETY